MHGLSSGFIRDVASQIPAMLARGGVLHSHTVTRGTEERTVEWVDFDGEHVFQVRYQPPPCNERQKARFDIIFAYTLRYMYRWVNTEIASTRVLDNELTLIYLAVNRFLSFSLPLLRGTFTKHSLNFSQHTTPVVVDSLYRYIWR